MMHGLRRRFASWALALIALQAALVFAAPLASSCATPSHATAQTERDCCPAGSHAPGECPLHRRAGSASSSSSSSAGACRLACDAPHGAQFLVAGIAIVPADTGASVITLSEERLARTAAVQPLTRSRVPDPPPPRSL
jgi:hypothetical protein